MKHITRRAFLAGAGASALGLAAAARAASAPRAAAPSEPVTIGSGHWTYTLDPAWGTLPEGMKFGWGAAIVADGRDRIYVHSRAPQAVAVFDRSGTLLSTWGAEFAGTGHGLYWHREGRDEFLYFTDHPRNVVVKTDLDGNVLMRIGKVESESPTQIAFPFNQPTDLAIAPNGDLYVCEGYGGNRVHRFRRDGKFLQTIGEPGEGKGQFQCPHGIWVDVRKGEPELYVADRNNGRLQVLHLNGEYKRSLPADVRAPCCFYTRRGEMFIPDLQSRVTILDKNDRLVAHLGDGKEIKSQATFQAPHALCLDSRGDLYVIERLPYARPRRFRHTPRA